MKLIRKTKSVCPEHVEQHDFRTIEAELWESGNQVIMTKSCPEHGDFEDLISTDYQDFIRAEGFANKGTGIQHPITELKGECPTRCGVCSEHESKTVLAISDATNRCNLECPVCFANAGAPGYVVEPTIQQIGRAIATAIKANSPKKIRALQLSGGEPTMRSDLPDIIRLIKGYGIKHVEINTNGWIIGDEKYGIEYLKKLRDSGLHTLYLQFDGLTPESRLESRVPKYTRSGARMPEDERLKIAEEITKRQLNVIENIREINNYSGKEKMGVVLVVTLTKKYNSDQIGPIARYAAENSDVVRCVNIQPISIAGRMDREKLREVRITHADLIRLYEEQTNGEISRDDWYSIPILVPFAEALEVLTGRHDYYDRFSTHPQCGRTTFTYVVKDGDGVRFDPITRHLDVKKFYGTLTKAREQGRLRAALTVAYGILRHTDLKLKRDLLSLILSRSYESTGDFMRKLVMHGDMWFMDAYNFDFDRAQKCTIHYIIPDDKLGARLIPFCTYNNFHRPIIEKELAVSSPKK